MIKPVTSGGYGMLDIEQLDSSLKLRALGRLLVTRHPFLSLVKDQINLEEFFEPKCSTNLDEVAASAIKILKEDRKKLWLCRELDSNRAFMATVRQTKIKTVVSVRGQQSISFFMITRRGGLKVGNITKNDLNQLAMFIDHTKISKLGLAIDLRLREDSLKEQIYVNGSFKSMTTLSSKEIRLSRANNKPLTTLKIGIDLEDSEARTWYYRIGKISSTAHKNTLLKVMHGEIYTKERQYRFGLSESPICPRCDEIETLEHKLIECAYARRIWNQVNLRLSKTPSNNAIKDILATSEDLTVLTVQTEIIQRILFLKETQTYLKHPKCLVDLAIKDLARKEGNPEIKNEIEALLE